MAKRSLTKQQELFLEALFGEADGDLYAAKRIAGYSPNYSMSEVISTLKDEIVERTKTYLALHAPKASIKLTKVLDAPEKLGNDNILKAAKEILDRAGVNKSETVEIGSGGIFILPAKRTD